MPWKVEFHDAFDIEYEQLGETIQDEVVMIAKLLENFGPQLGRPNVDTLKGSTHANMKEMRFKAGGGVWRVAFAFDLKRRAIVLVAGDKSGMSEKLFYRQLIDKADARFSDHLARQRAQDEKRGKKGR